MTEHMRTGIERMADWNEDCNLFLDCRFKIEAAKAPISVKLIPREVIAEDSFRGRTVFSQPRRDTLRG